MIDVGLSGSFSHGLPISHFKILKTLKLSPKS